MKRLSPLLVGLFIITSLAHAQGHHGACHMENPEMRERGHMMLEMLDLSDEQRNQVEATRTEKQKKIIPIKADIELKHVDLKKEMRADEPNRSKLMSLTKEISNLELKIKQLKIDERLRIHSILTREQREQLKKSKHKAIKKKIMKKHRKEEDID